MGEVGNSNNLEITRSGFKSYETNTLLGELDKLLVVDGLIN